MAISAEKAFKFMELAKFQANLFSKDPNTKVGAILLAPESFQILSMGFNGMPRKINESVMARWERPTKYMYVCHAEANAICNAARHGTPLMNSIAVVTFFPCCDCAKSLIQCGVQSIVTPPPSLDCPRWGESHTIASEMFEEAGVKIIDLKK
jgi:dCMP deaminase